MGVCKQSPYKNRLVPYNICLRWWVFLSWLHAYTELLLYSRFAPHLASEVVLARYPCLGLVIAKYCPTIWQKRCVDISVHPVWGYQSDVQKEKICIMCYFWVLICLSLASVLTVSQKWLPVRLARHPHEHSLWTSRLSALKIETHFFSTLY